MIMCAIILLCCSWILKAAQRTDNIILNENFKRCVIINVDHGIELKYIPRSLVAVLNPSM